MSAGTGMAALRRLVAEFDARTGRDTRSDPVLRSRLVDVHIRTEVLRYHSQRIISKLAKGEIPTAEGSISKLALTDLITRVADLGVDLQGPYGTLGGRDPRSDREWALAFLGSPGMRIAGGTDEIMRNIVGERVLGLPGEPRLDKGVPFREVPRSA